MIAKREDLPTRRASETIRFECSNGHSYLATYSCFSDGRVAEVFIDGHKMGSDTATAAHDAAVLLSIALQHGVPLETMRRALSRRGDGQAMGPLGTVLDILSEKT